MATTLETPVLIPSMESPKIEQVVLPQIQTQPSTPVIVEIAEPQLEPDTLGPVPVEVPNRLRDEIYRTHQKFKTSLRKRDYIMKHIRCALESAKIKTQQGIQIVSASAGPALFTGALAAGGLAFSYSSILGAVYTVVVTPVIWKKLQRPTYVPTVIDGLVQNISDFLKVPLNKDIIRVIVTLILVGYVATSPRFSTIEKVLAAMAGAWLSKETIYALFEQLTSLAQGLRIATKVSSLFTSDFKPQTDEDRKSAISGVYSSVMKTICSVLHISGGDRISKEENDDISRIRNQFGLVKDAHMFAHWITSLVHSVVNQIHIHYYGVPSKNPENEVLIDLVTTYCANVEKFVTANVQANIAIHVEIYDQLKKLIEQGEETSSAIVRNKMSIGQFPRLRSALSLLKETDALIQSYSRFDYGRPEPVYIHIDGPPGTGKSTLAQMLFKDLAMCKMHLDHYKATLVFSKRFSKEAFWEGYFNQPFVLFEEIWQNKDEDQRAEVAIFLLHLINVHIMPLDMAFGGKGRTFFDSRVLISTANGDENNLPAFNGMQDKMAYFRRIDFWIRVHKPKLELDELSGDYIVDLLDPAEPTKPRGTDIPYAELLRLVIAKWDEKEKSVTKNVIHTLAREDPHDSFARIFNLPHSECAWFFDQIKNQTTDRHLLEFAAKWNAKIIPKKEEVAAFRQHLMERFKSDDGKKEIVIPKPEPEVTLPNTQATWYYVPKLTWQAKLGKKVTEKQQQIHLAYLELVKKIQFNWKAFLASSTSWITKTRVAIVCGLTLAVGTSYFIYKNFNALSELLPQSYEAARPHKVQKTGRKPGAKFDVSKVASRRINLEPQSIQVTGQEINMFSNNMAMVSTDITANLCNVTFLCDRIGVTTAHSFKRVLAGDYKTTIKLSGNSKLPNPCLINPKDIDFVILEDLDLLFMKINDKKIPQFPTIVHHLVDNSETEKYNDGIGVLTLRPGKPVLTSTQMAVQILDQSYGEEYVPLGYSAKIATVNGDCGALWMSLSTLNQKKLFGLHVAGNGASAICTVLSRDVVDPVLRQFEIRPEGKEDLVCLSEWEYINMYRTGDAAIPEQGLPVEEFVSARRERLAVLLPDRKVNMPAKTCLVKSPAFEELYENTKVPALLRPNRKTGYNPLLESVKKACRPKTVTSPETLALFKTYVNLFVDEYRDPNVKFRTLTLDEALNPQKVCPHIGQMNLATSTGYPFNIDVRGAGKSKFVKATPVTLNGNIIGVLHELEKWFDDYYQDSWAKLATDDPPVCIFQLSLKDELRKIGKETRPRAFFPLPIDYQVHQRRLYGVLVDTIIEKHNSHPIKLGINPLGIEWTVLKQYLVKNKAGEVCDEILQGDIGSNDWCQRVENMMIVYEALNSLYPDDEDTTRRVNCSLKVGDPTVLILNILYKLGINPSGQFLTTIENSVHIPCALFVCIHRILESKGVQVDPVWLFRRIAAAAFGDDTVLSFNSKTIPVTFTEVQEKMMELFGLEYTNPAKDDKILDHTKLEDMQFLNRKFRKEGLLEYAPLTESSITAQTNWYSITNKGMVWSDHWLNSINNALSEWYQYGYDRFKQEREKIVHNLLVRECFQLHEILTYDTVHFNYFKMEHHETQDLDKNELHVVEIEDLPHEPPLEPQGCDVGEPHGNDLSNPRVFTSAAQVLDAVEEAVANAEPTFDMATEAADDYLEWLDQMAYQNGTRVVDLIAQYFTEGTLTPTDPHLDIGMYTEPLFVLRVYEMRIDDFAVCLVQPSFNEGCNVDPMLVAQYFDWLRESIHQPVLYMRFQDARRCPPQYLPTEGVMFLPLDLQIIGGGLDFLSEHQQEYPENDEIVDPKVVTIDDIREVVEGYRNLSNFLRALSDLGLEDEEPPLVPQSGDFANYLNPAPVHMEFTGPPDFDPMDYDSDGGTLPSYQPQGIEVDRSFVTSRQPPPRLLTSEEEWDNFDWGARAATNARINALERRRVFRDAVVEGFWKGMKWCVQFLIGYIFYFVCSFFYNRYREENPLCPQGIEDLKNQTVSDGTTEDRTQLTAFTDEAATDMNVVRMKSSLYTREDPYPNQNLDTVLSRAYTVNSLWTSALAQGTLVQQFDFPTDLIGLSDNILQKLDRFTYFRAAVKIQIRVNGTPFHYGKLMCVWMPNYPGAYPTGTYEVSNLYRSSCNNTTLISANTSNVVEIVIPYLAPAKYMLLEDIDTYPYYFGSLNIYVLHPLLSSSSTTVPNISVAYTLSFVNPEVAGLTSTSFASQAMARYKRNKSAKEKQKLYPQGKEQIMASKQGFLSGTLDVVSKIASVMTTLPVVGGIASAVCPIAKAASSLAKSFGYDKPTDLKPPMPILPMYQPRLDKGVGVDSHDILSVYPDNAVSAEKGYFCDDQDYTIIANYAKLPGMISINSFTGLTDGQVLQYIPVAPGYAHYVTGAGPTYTYDTTPVQAVSTLFRYWTGGMKYCIKIATSSFVSWRLRITFIPNHIYSVAPDPGNGDYTSRIVDINGDTTITFMIPYLGITEYMRSAPAHFLVDATAGPAYLPLTVLGQLVLSVANAPSYTASTVTPTIYQTIWVAGAEDFRVASPVEADQGVITVPLEVSSSRAIFSPEGLEEDSEVPRRLFQHVFEPLVGEATSIIRSGLVMGEEVTSLLTLGHRFTENQTYNGVPASQGQEYSLQWRTSMTAARAVQDTKTYLRQMFLFSRGGTRYTLHFDAFLNGYPQVVKIKAAPSENTPMSVSGHSLYNPMYSNSGINITQNFNGTMAQIAVPFYSQFALVNHKYVVGRETTQQCGIRFFVTLLDVSNDPTMWVYEAFADDYSMGFPKTPLPLIYDYSAMKAEKPTGGITSVTNKSQVSISLLK